MWLKPFHCIYIVANYLPLFDHIRAIFKVYLLKQKKPTREVWLEVWGTGVNWVHILRFNLGKLIWYNLTHSFRISKPKFNRAKKKDLLARFSPALARFWRSQVNGSSSASENARIMIQYSIPMVFEVLSWLKLVSRPKKIPKTEYWEVLGKKWYFRTIFLKNLTVT